mgnify:CR=1 FL=1
MFYGFFLLQRLDFFKRGKNSGFLIFPLSKNLKGFLRNGNDQNMYTEMNSSWKNEIKRRIQDFLTFEAKSFGEMINIFYAGMTYLYLNVEIICIIKLSNSLNTCSCGAINKMIRSRMGER